MKIDSFINRIIKDFGNTDHSMHTQIFIKILKEICAIKDCSRVKATQLTILLESFYQIFCSSCFHKLILYRQLRWKNHYGIPTLDFLLTHKKEIDKIKNLLKTNQNPLEKRIGINCIDNLDYDKENEVLVDVSAYRKVKLPKKWENTGSFIETYHSKGGFATTPSDPYSQKFIDYVNNLNSGSILEVGCAFGGVSIHLNSNKTKVYYNDLEQQNLAVVKARTKDILKQPNEASFLAASFPEELIGLPSNHFDAILICRVLHFLSGSKIEEGLQLISRILKPQGKLFIVCETPFLKNWQKFQSEYKERLTKKIKWPGEIMNASQYEDSGRSKFLPEFVHWITKDVLEEAVLRSNLFDIDHISYINRKGQFPEDLLLDGRESVGMVVSKK